MTTSLSVESSAGLRPRVANFPPYSTSAGLEAVELAASAGLVLDPWQAAVLVDALGERPGGMWSAFEVGVVVARQNGKGAIIEARELAGLFLFGEQLILHSAHEFKTAQEAFRRITGWIEGSDDLRKRVKRVTNANGDEGIELRTGARLRFVARSKGSGRGFSGDCNILDEAYALTAEQLAALMPTMSARPNPQIWYTSTPPLEAATQLVEIRKRGTAGARRMAYFEWSPPEDFRPTPKGEPATDADREMWVACNPAMGIRISEEFVEQERASLPDEEFARERLGVWPPSADGQWQVVPEDAWRDRVDLGSQLLDPVAFAAEVSVDRKHAAIGVAGLRADGSLHVEVVCHRTGTSWVADEAVKLQAKWKSCAFVVNDAGPAGSMIAALEAAGVVVTKAGPRDVGQACGQFYDGVCGDEPNIWHLDQGMLTAALAGALKRPLGDAWAWDRKGVSVDISPLMAATLALWGYATRPQEEQQAPFFAWA